TWLVLGVGILLIAFPKAHGVVLTALYLPTALMLVGLILRGVAFDFRVKARAQHKPLWNHAFFAGSTLASLAQGWMLGRYVTGFAEGVLARAFEPYVTTKSKGTGLGLAVVKKIADEHGARIRLKNLPAPPEAPPGVAAGGAQVSLSFSTFAPSSPACPDGASTVAGAGS
ncbi:cytochrome d ubiquinol oxidase subunit II, partial [Vibrio parahaemolyticus]|nr:cytochrome d ubiquinol oxidase subunit II [Vibrio parahaemolyticus]